MNAIERELAWCEWAYAFGTLLGSGVPLARTFELLAAQAASAETQQVSRQLLNGILTAKTILAPAASLPEPLPGFGSAFLRVGEVAGILDETSLVWAQALRCRVEQTIGFGPAAVTAELEEQRANNTLLRLLGMALSSNVPLSLAWEAAGLVFTDHLERAAQLQEGLSLKGPDQVAPVLEVLGYSPLVCQLAHVADLFGSPDRCLLRAAELLDYQLALRLLPLS